MLMVKNVQQKMQRKIKRVMIRLKHLSLKEIESVNQVRILNEIV